MRTARKLFRFLTSTFVPYFIGSFLRQGADTDVWFATQRALLHIAAIHAQVAQDRAQFGQIGISFFRAVDVGLADDFHKRRAGTVQID